MADLLHPDTLNTDTPFAVGKATPPTGEASAATAQHIEGRLDQLQQLAELLDADGPHRALPINYDVPVGFKLSVVIPVYNEQATISNVLARITALPLPTEIIVVDDHSTDQTAELLRPLEGAAGIRILFKPQNEGKGAALRDGFRASTGDIVIVQDADLEYDPRDIPALLKPILDDQADAVYGSRFLGHATQDPSRLHRFGNRLLTGASNLVTGLRLTDMETCYKAFRGDLIRTLPISQNRFGFEPEVTARLARRGCRVLELPISYRARSYQEGKKIGWKDGFNAFYCIARYAWWD